MEIIITGLAVIGGCLVANLAIELGIWCFKWLRRKWREGGSD